MKKLQANITSAISKGDTLSPEVIDARLQELQKELLKKANQNTDYDAIADEILRLRDMRKQAAAITEFDEALVNRHIAKMTVFEDYFTVDFKSGLSVDIEG